MADDCRGKTYFITGASTGFGRALAEEILARGGNVVATARDESTLQHLTAIDPARVATARLDVTAPDQIAPAVALAEQRFGRIDVLINNAGYGLIAGIEEASEEQYRHQFETNFFGLVALTRAVLPIMRRQNGGHIVNLSSIAGAIGMQGSAYYSASKWAVEGLSEGMAQELAPLGIRVTIVEPSAFRTEFFGRSYEKPDQPVAGYEHLEQSRKIFAERDGQQPGDPVRGAKAMIDTTVVAEPPRRLLIGSAAYEMVSKAMATRVEEAEASKVAAESADFPAEQMA